MRSQANRNYHSNDAVMTPDPLARLIVDCLRPHGRILEPCAGDGAFVRALRGYGTVLTCEATVGQDFSWWTAPVDWIITNPPWSKFRSFLTHALEVADHIVFLATINHWWTRRRVDEVVSRGYGYRDLLLLAWPPEFPASGFQLGAMHLEKQWTGPLRVLDYREFETLGVPRWRPTEERSV